MRRLGLLSTIAFVAVIAVAIALAVRSSGTDVTEGGPATDEVSGELVVSAAASLTDAFGEIVEEFERRHEDVDISLNLGGSSALAEQVRGGAPADVLASADLAVMADLESDGATAEEPTVFATNQLVLVVPADNPAFITALGDLADPTLVVGLCAPEVPCGRYARTALTTAGIDPSVVADTEEPDVRALLTKVALGELDAGITYATDVQAAEGEVAAIPIPGPEAAYPIAALWDAPNPVAARAFVTFVTSPDGRAILRRWGFGGPP